MNQYHALPLAMGVGHEVGKKIQIGADRKKKFQRNANPPLKELVKNLVGKKALVAVRKIPSSPKHGQRFFGEQPPEQEIIVIFLVLLQDGFNQTFGIIGYSGTLLQKRLGVNRNMHHRPVYPRFTPLSERVILFSSRKSKSTPKPIGKEERWNPVK